MLEVFLRPSTDSDIAFLRELYFDSRSYEMTNWGWGEDQQRNFIDLQFNARNAAYAEQYPNAESSIIMLEDEPVGRILVARDDHELRLVDLAVLGRVQRRGIASKFLKLLQDEATTTLVLQVEINNPANRLYRKLGFKNVSERGGYFLMMYQRAPSPLT